MTKIVLKHGTGVPSDTDLEVAEVAIDNVSGAMYTKLADDSVKHLNEGGASDWGSITGKPTEYPPEDHDHDGVYQPVGDYIEDADSDGKQYARQDGAWSEIVIPEASNTLEGSWVYSSSSATVGSFTTRNADWITAVTITLHKTDASGFEHNFALMNEGDIIYLQAPAGGAEYSVVSKSVSGDTCDFIVDPISSYGSFPSDGQSAKVNFIPQVSSGSSVHIGPTPPDTPLEGQQWMEVPTAVDQPAMMWVYDGAKWLEHPSGVDGAPGADGNIQDATEDGVIATWNNTDGRWTPESGIRAGDDGTYEELVINGGSNVNAGGKLSLITGDGKKASLYNWFGSAFLQGELSVQLNYNGKTMYQIDGVGHRFYGPTGADEHLRIDPSGNATFSGKVTSGHIVSARSSGLNGVGNTVIGAYIHAGAASSSWALCGFDENTSPLGGVRSNGDGWFKGNLYKNGGTPVTTTRDLIETLHTLREATKDESTLEGLRDAIGNAVGGLIEKFEAMQNEAVTQDIQEGPVTQEISDEE